MVAQVTLDHSVWVRALVPEPKWRYGQAAKTSPSQGEITSSILVSATMIGRNLHIEIIFQSANYFKEKPHRLMWFFYYEVEFPNTSILCP